MHEAALLASGLQTLKWPDHDEPVVIPLDVLVEYRRALCQLLGSVGGSSYPVYPLDGDQVPFDLVQHPVRADAQRHRLS